MCSNGLKFVQNNLWCNEAAISLLTFVNKTDR